MDPFPAFITFWAAMMIAMMLPSAVPMVSVRPSSALVVAAIYILTWTAFGAAAYVVYVAIPSAVAPWLGGIALALAAVYALTPLQRRFRDQCRALCRQGGVQNVIAYSINCVGCSIGVMIALILLGLSSLSWMVLASALVFLYKVVSMPRWVDVALAGGMIAAGLLLAIQA